MGNTFYFSKQAYAYKSSFPPAHYFVHTIRSSQSKQIQKHMESKRERASIGRLRWHPQDSQIPTSSYLHTFLPPVYISQLNLPPPRHHSSPSSPLPTHPAAITAASPRSRPGWLHSRGRSRGSSAPSPSSTPTGVLSASTKVGSLPLSVPPLPRSVHELIFLLFRPDALAFAIPCFPDILMLS